MMTESISIEKAIREYSNAELLQYLQDIENEENPKRSCRSVCLDGVEVFLFFFHRVVARH